MYGYTIKTVVVFSCCTSPTVGISAIKTAAKTLRPLILMADDIENANGLNDLYECFQQRRKNNYSFAKKT